MIWKKYLAWISKGKNIDSVDFRNKQDFGWREHIESIYFNNKRIDSKVWTNLFYSGNMLRPACYECRYKNLVHPGDLTIADYWNIEKAAPEFDDNKGVSLVLVNSEKGRKLFDKTKPDIIWKETQIEDSMQRAFIRSEYRPNSREVFWQDVEKNKFSYIAKKYGGYMTLGCKLISKVKQKIKRLKNNRISNVKE